MAECAYGGQPGALVSSLKPKNPPSRGCRVLSGRVWWQLVWWPWRQYVAANATGYLAVPPTLSYPGAKGFYFTDQESLYGVYGPADYAMRLSLRPLLHLECQLYGCAIIEFDVVGYPNTQFQQGLTGRGARQWWMPTNIPLSDNMDVKYVPPLSAGHTHFNVHL